MCVYTHSGQCVSHPDSAKGFGTAQDCNFCHLLLVWSGDMWISEKSIWIFEEILKPYLASFEVCCSLPFFLSGRDLQFGLAGIWCTPSSEILMSVSLSPLPHPLNVGVVDIIRAHPRSMHSVPCTLQICYAVWEGFSRCEWIKNLDLGRLSWIILHGGLHVVKEILIMGRQKGQRGRSRQKKIRERDREFWRCWAPGLKDTIKATNQGMQVTSKSWEMILS